MTLEVFFSDFTTDFVVMWEHDWPFVQGTGVQISLEPNFFFLIFKAPLHTKLTLMDCGIGNTNLLGSSSSVLGYDCFYMKSTDGATMYFNLGSGIGSGRIQTDY